VLGWVVGHVECGKRWRMIGRMCRMPLKMADIVGNDGRTCLRRL
jgi:hypothetical protein